jgi:nucleoside phosphorylase
MIYIVTALHAEAAILIEHYQLQKIKKNPYPIYQNRDIILIISGIGKIEAAIATTYLLTHYQATSNDRVFNIGIASSSKSSLKIGTLFHINKIIDDATARVYHLADGEYAITCVDRACHSPQGIKTPLIDMESIGIFLAAKEFLSKDAIMIVKIISDHTDSTIPSPENVKSLIEKNIATIGALLEL